MIQRSAFIAFGESARLVLERVRLDVPSGATAAWLMCNPSDADALAAVRVATQAPVLCLGTSERLRACGVGSGLTLAV